MDCIFGNLYASFYADSSGYWAIDISLVSAVEKSNVSMLSVIVGPICAPVVQY